MSAAFFLLGSYKGWSACTPEEVNKATIKALTPAYNEARELHAHATGKKEEAKDLSTITISQLNQEILRLLREAKVAKCPSTPPSASLGEGARDFEKEYKELSEELGKPGLSQKDTTALNIKMEKLIAEANKAGKPIGGIDEAAEEKKKVEEASRAQKEAREAAKKAEKEEDLAIYKKRSEWISKTTDPATLEGKLKLTNNELYPMFTNAKSNSEIMHLVENESSEKVLRSYRHITRAYLAIKETPRQTERLLSDLEAKITNRLENLGVAPAAASGTVSTFTATPDEKSAYEKFQFIWKKAQENKESPFFIEISKKKNDVIFSYITSSPEELKNKNLNKAALNNILLSQATLLELEAFVSALSQGQISLSARDFTARLDEIRNQITGIKRKTIRLGYDINQRAKEEETLSSGFVPSSMQAGGMPPPPPPSGHGGPPPPPSGVLSGSGKHSPKTSSKSGPSSALFEDIKKRRKDD